MGLNTPGTGGSNKNFLGIFSNQLVMEFKKKEDLEAKVEALGLDPEKIQVRQKTKGENEGQDVFYYVFRELEGAKLTNIRLNDTDWGEFVELEFTDVDQKFIISLGDVFSRTSKDFIRRVENLDLDEDITFRVWSMTAEETGRSAKSGVTMYQDGNKVEYAVSYDDMPAPVEKKKGKKVEWDYTDQEDYLYNVLVDFIKENFKEDVKEEKPEPKPEPEQKKPAASSARKPRARAGASAGSSEGKDDDLPF